MTPEDDPRTWLEGTPYKPSAVLGRGAMGVVLVARHEKLGSEVCVKVLRPEATAQPGLVDRFRLEAQALAKLGGGNHPNLVHVRDFGETPAGRWYLVMERLHGCTFEEERRQRGPIPWREAVGYVTQALAGLAVAHQAGVLHRDIKPANLFLCNPVGGGAGTEYAGTGRPPRVAKVLDFGIAKLAELATIASEVPRLAVPTAEGMALGTLRYMAPEQLGGAELDARMDVYAMGLVLWGLTTGKLPHEDKNSEALVRAQVRELLPAPSTLVEVPEGLDAIVRDATAKRREERPAHAGALLARLEALLQESEPLASERSARSVGPVGALGPAGTELVLRSPAPPPAATTERTQPYPRTSALAAAAEAAEPRTVRLSPKALPVRLPPTETGTSTESTTSRVPARSEAGSGADRAAESGRRLLMLVTIAATLLFTALGGAILSWCSS